MWQRDREIAVALDDPPGIDDRHADHLAAVVVAHTMPLGRERCVGRAARLPAGEVQHVSFGVVVTAVEYEVIDLDVHGIHPSGERPCRYPSAVTTRAGSCSESTTTINHRLGPTSCLKNRSR